MRQPTPFAAYHADLLEQHARLALDVTDEATALVRRRAVLAYG
jgi:hypothetical protein